MQESKNNTSPGCVYYVGDTSEFKTRNRAEWERNAQFWMQGKMRHLTDVYDTVVLELTQILGSVDKPKPDILVVDTGCGEGWTIRALRDAGFSGRYVGLDFNPPFIHSLKEQYAHDPSKEFRLHDMENPLPEDLISSADLVLNFFNLFELPQLDTAFRNISQLLTIGGSLLILHIDVMTQLLAVSTSLDELRRNLRLYEQHRTCLGYDKDIDIGDNRSGRFYRSLLYSASDYFRCAKAQGLTYANFHEIVKTGNYVPQIYQILQFRRPEE
ncbi:MAG: class I SAM-dependent methyltransferase [Planctomycetota bacterium]|nr:class I SAM-dependent methyltransferase [Planctomycetota bacterium]